MGFKNIRIVLVETSHPGNIGSCARAMKTMGFSELVLVNPVVFPHQQALDLAAGADDILQQARVVSSLSEALVDSQLVIGTSARTRHIGLPIQTPRACVESIAHQLNALTISLVFGRESSGLTNQELLQCNLHVHIPTDPVFSSLNIAQAVQLLCYEFRLRQNEILASSLVKEEPLASHEAVEQFYDHLEKVLIDIDFLNPAHPKQLRSRLRRLFNRVQLEQMEVNILRGVLTAVEKRCRYD